MFQLPSLGVTRKQTQIVSTSFLPVVSPTAAFSYIVFKIWASGPLTEDEGKDINCLFSNLDTKISIHLSPFRNEVIIDGQHMYFLSKHFIILEKMVI